MGTAQKQISKLQVRYDYVAELGDKTNYCVHINTHHDKTDLKLTGLFSFSSGEESSPHNTSPLEVERLYLRSVGAFIPE